MYIIITFQETVGNHSSFHSSLLFSFEEDSPKTPKLPRHGFPFWQSSSSKQKKKRSPKRKVSLRFRASYLLGCSFPSETSHRKNPKKKHGKKILEKLPLRRSVKKTSKTPEFVMVFETLTCSDSWRLYETLPNLRLQVVFRLEKGEVTGWFPPATFAISLHLKRRSCTSSQNVSDLECLWFVWRNSPKAFVAPFQLLCLQNESSCNIRFQPAWRGPYDCPKRKIMITLQGLAPDLCAWQRRPRRIWSHASPPPSQGGTPPFVTTTRRQFTQKNHRLPTKPYNLAHKPEEPPSQENSKRLKRGGVFEWKKLQMCARMAMAICHHLDIEALQKQTKSVWTLALGQALILQQKMVWP